MKIQLLEATVPRPPDYSLEENVSNHIMNIELSLSDSFSFYISKGELHKSPIYYSELLLSSSLFYFFFNIFTKELVEVIAVF